MLKSNTDEDGYLRFTMSPGACEIESLNKEIKSIIIDEGHYTEANHPFTIKPNFSKLGSIIAISTRGITFQPDDSIRDHLGINRTTINEEYNISQNPVVLLFYYYVTFFFSNVISLKV